jgi:hypothetical protein
MRITHLASTGVRVVARADPGRIVEDNFSGFVAGTVKSIREGKKGMRILWSTVSAYEEIERGVRIGGVRGNAPSWAQGTRIRDLIAN